MRKLLLSLCAATCAVSAFAQPVALTDGKVVTPTEVIDGATVVFDDGKIVAIGRSVAIPSDATRIDMQGRYVTAGIVAATSGLGVVEVGAVAGTRDNRVSDEAGFSAAFDVSYGVNPRATAIPVARIEGLTRAGVMAVPGDSIFGGYGAVIHLGDAQDVVTKAQAFMTVNLGQDGGGDAGGARGAAMVAFIRSIEEAARYRDETDKDRWESDFLHRLDAEALVPVTTGDVPLFVAVHRASDIIEVIQLARRYTKLDIVLIGAREGWLVADQIQAAGFPVILNPFDNLPGDFASLAATQRNAARLAEADVTIAFAPGADASNIRLILQHAGNAVANGLPWLDAMNAVTINAATVLGVADQFGSLAPGKAADIVVWDGDPLEVMASPDHVFIAGEEIELVSRQTKLRDRYRVLDGDLPPAYRR